MELGCTTRGGEQLQRHSSSHQLSPPPQASCDLLGALWIANRVLRQGTEETEPGRTKPWGIWNGFLRMFLSSPCLAFSTKLRMEPEELRRWLPEPRSSRGS